MNFLFAPNEDRAQHFLKHNHFGLEPHEVKVRLNYTPTLGEIYREGDTLYVLDGCHPTLLSTMEKNLRKARGNPRVVSVEER